MSTYIKSFQRYIDMDLQTITNLMVNRNPMRRLGRKEEIGELAAYLMSDAAEYE